MKIRCLVSLLFVFLATSLFADNLEDYINKATADRVKLTKKGEFTTGMIYFRTGDSLNTEMFRFRGGDPVNNYLFVVCKRADSLVIYRPSDLAGYVIDDTRYLSIVTPGSQYFIRQTEQGRVDLYERRSIPYDDKYLYFMDFAEKNYFFMLSPSESSFTDYNEAIVRRSADFSSDRLQSGIYKRVFTTDSSRELKFILFVETLMGDCEQLRNRTSSGSLNIEDISEITRIYNNCGSEQ